jgi:hypothetical protein
MSPRRPLVMLSLSAALAACTAPAALAEPFSHAEWTQVLQRHVDERGNVAYRALAKDRGLLDRYLTRVAKVGPKTQPGQFPDRAHQLAYYINAYNAHVFAGVLSRGPEEESVWTGGLLPGQTGYAFFVGMDIEVDGRETNLKALEDDVIRAGFQDPRIHAALNCASRGCPRLPRKAFEGPTLEAELDAEMRRFVAEPRNVKVDAQARTVTLSKIFDWFADDFLGYEKRQGNAGANQLDYVNRYRAADARVPRDFAIRFFEYDKRLNKQ